jgi:hypothetical protein
MVCGLRGHGRRQEHAESGQPGKIRHMNKYNPASSNTFSRIFRSLFRSAGPENEKVPFANDTDDALPSSKLTPPPRNASSGTSSQYTISQAPRKEPEPGTFSKVVKWLKSPSIFTSGKVSRRPSPLLIPGIVEPGITVPKADVALFVNSGSRYPTPDGPSLPDPKALHESVPLPKPPSYSGESTPLLHPSRIPHQPSQGSSQRAPSVSTVSLPPISGEEDGSMNGIPRADEDQVATWFREHPLVPPLELSAIQLGHIRAGMLTLTKPRYSNAEVGTYHPIPWPRVKTEAGSPAISFTSTHPLYAARYHAPTLAGGLQEVYFEVNAMPDWFPNKQQFSLGFAAHPYPDDCLPGYQRGSVAFHIDERQQSLYIGSQQNGHEISTLFSRGDRVGIGMRFSSLTIASLVDVEVFLTLNGEELGSWEIEKQNAELVGLDGHFDIFPMVGIVDKQYLEVKFKNSDWMYKSQEDRY